MPLKVTVRLALKGVSLHTIDCQMEDKTGCTEPSNWAECKDANLEHTMYVGTQLALGRSPGSIEGIQHWLLALSIGC